MTQRNGPGVNDDVVTRFADWVARALVLVLLFAGYLTWLGDSPVTALLFGCVVALLVRAWFRRPWAIDNRRAVTEGRSAQIGDVDLMTGREFQQLIAGLMRRDSFEGVRMTGLRDDLSMDVLGCTPAGRRVVVQCNRDAPHRRVDSSAVERLLDSAQDELAVLVTTGRFSRAAIALGERRDVVLLDRSQVAAWMTGRTTQLTPYLI